MKKLFYLFAFAALAFVACGDDDTTDPVQPDVPVVEATIEFTTDVANLTLPEEGGELKVGFTASHSWTVFIVNEADAAYTTVAPTYGPSGAQELTITVAANEVDQPREIAFQIKSEETVADFKVTQAEKFIPKFSSNMPESGEVWVDCKAQDWVLEIDANIDYSIEFDDVDWVTATDNGDDTYTFSFAENTAMEYRSMTGTLDCELFEEPQAFALFQSGVGSTTWSVSLESLGFVHGTPSPMALYGEYLLLGNGGNILALNPADGTVAQTIALPEGMLAHNLCVDEGGNILIAANTAFGYEDANVMTIYKATGLDAAPVELLKYHAGNIYCSQAGNMRVAGDVTKNATITLTAGVWYEDAGWWNNPAENRRYWVAFQVENGVVPMDENGWWPLYAYGFTAYGFNGPANGCVVPVGEKLSDGLYFAGYGGDYNIYYAEGLDFAAKDCTAATWNLSVVTGSSWMENYNALDLVEYNGKTYMAVVQACVTDYDRPDILLVDVTDPLATATIGIYSGWYIQSADSVTLTASPSDDIVAVAVEDGIVCYMNDAPQDVIACVKFRL